MRVTESPAKPFRAGVAVVRTHASIPRPLCRRPDLMGDGGGESLPTPSAFHLKGRKKQVPGTYLLKLLQLVSAANTWKSELILFPSIHTDFAFHPGVGLFSHPKSWHKRAWKGRCGGERRGGQSHSHPGVGPLIGTILTIRPNGELLRREASKALWDGLASFFFSETPRMMLIATLGVRSVGCLWSKSRVLLLPLKRA